ncbi:MAG: hypothetical protein AAGA67_05765 [Cyanobacteria bacterium P01_F01_bin.153]
MGAIVPITPTEVLPAIHPEHQQASYGQIVELCQANAYGQLAQMLTEYRTFLTQEFNQGSITSNSSQHAELVTRIIGLQARAGDLAIAVQQNTQQLTVNTGAIDLNTTQLDFNTQQLALLNNNIEAYMAMQRQQQSCPVQPIQVQVFNEVHGHGGRANADSKSESATDGEGSSRSWLMFWATLVVTIIAVATTVDIYSSRPTSRPNISQPQGGGT